MTPVKWSDVTSRFLLLSGAIFHAGDEEHIAAFQSAIYKTKFEHVAPAFKLESIIKQVEVNTDSFRTAAAGLYEYSIHIYMYIYLHICIYMHILVILLISIY